MYYAKRYVRLYLFTSATISYLKLNLPWTSLYICWPTSFAALRTAVVSLSECGLYYSHCTSLSYLRTLLNVFIPFDLNIGRISITKLISNGYEKTLFRLLLLLLLLLLHIQHKKGWSQAKPIQAKKAMHTQVYVFNTWCAIYDRFWTQPHLHRTPFSRSRCSFIKVQLNTNFEMLCVKSHSSDRLIIFFKSNFDATPFHSSNANGFFFSAEVQMSYNW